MSNKPHTFFNEINRLGGVEQPPSLAGRLKRHRSTGQALDESREQCCEKPWGSLKYAGLRGPSNKKIHVSL
jgi:hypothetical protein